MNVFVKCNLIEERLAPNGTLSKRVQKPGAMLELLGNNRSGSFFKKKVVTAKTYGRRKDPERLAQDWALLLAGTVVDLCISCVHLYKVCLAGRKP